ncbi:MAG: hypothetical protein ACLPKB_17300, partial [Xanthobacteraceae bacterium]
VERQKPCKIAPSGTSLAYYRHLFTQTLQKSPISRIKVQENAHFIEKMVGHVDPESPMRGGHRANKHLL